MTSPPDNQDTPPAKASLWALSPLLVFFLLYLVISIAVQDFYAVPVTVAFMAAAVWAVFITRGKSMAERVDLFSSGVANRNILMMVWIFVLAGAFAQSARDMGAIDATVQLTLRLLPDNLLLASVFIASCFISLSVGTSVGTIVALAPVATGLAQATQVSAGMMTAIVVGGAFFGDNLSFISDTTIAATRTQGCAMRDKFRANIKVALPAALLALACYILLGWNVQSPSTADISIEWMKVFPYLLVLVTALAGIHVMAVLTMGLLATGLIGIGMGYFSFMAWFQAMGSGMTGMGELIIVTLLAGGVLSIIRFNGGIAYIIGKITAHIHSRRGAEFSIAGLVSLANLCTANNTIAIITAGPIAKEISDKFHIPPKRSASILDTFSCLVQGVIPYGAQMLMAAGISQVSPLLVMKYLYYPLILGICSTLAIALAPGGTEETLKSPYGERTARPPFLLPTCYPCYLHVTQHMGFLCYHTCMSLHIEPTEDAVETLRKERRKNYIAALATSILSVVLAGAILYSLTIIIAPPEEPKVVGYITPDDAPPSDTPPPPEVQRETSSSSHAETPVKVVVAAAAAPVSLPKIDIDPPDEPVMLEEGTALGMGDGFGPDLGDATSAFGTSKPSGSTLVGTFYDTKQTPGGRPTNMNMNQYREFLSRFVNKGWNESELNRFYKAPQQLYAAQFYIPRTPAKDAPKAYGCDDKVKPSQWLAIYRGKVRAPKSGTFRFVGLGDDYLVVRFNKQNVFDYGWESASLGKMTANNAKWLDAMEGKPGNDDLKKELREVGINVPPVTFYKYSSSGHWNNTMRGVAAGKQFTVEQGKVYPIEILVSEGPGGEFGMTLLLEEVGMAPMSKDPKTGAPILPLFRTNYGVPKPDKNKEHVPFDEIGIVWESIK